MSISISDLTIRPAGRVRLLEVDESALVHRVCTSHLDLHAAGAHVGERHALTVLEHEVGPVDVRQARRERRSLVLLHLDGSEGVLPAAGSVVSLGDKEVGHVTSSARHFELGPIALAVVKRNVDPTATLAVAADELTIAAAQEVIVPTDAGAVADVPRLPRLGAVQR